MDIDKVYRLSKSRDNVNGKSFKDNKTAKVSKPKKNIEKKEAELKEKK